MSDLEIHEDPDGEWAALYQDGELVTVGDKYIAVEKAFAILGVRTVQDDAFMRGQEYRDGVATTLAEVAAYRAEREDRSARAAVLREQARALEAEAAALERP